MFKFFDLHSHLNLSQFDADRDDQINKLEDLHIGTITVGVDYDTSLAAIEIAEKSPNIYACIGLHPADNTDEVFDFEKYKVLAQNPKVVAIGECGLDYYREVNEEMKLRQKEIFDQHIRLAESIGKPLMIHARPSKGSMNAYEDVLDILEVKNNSNLKANFHFFVGDLTIAKRILALGFTMSFDGPITFARDYDEVIQYVPLTSILAETDAPFATPVPYRGARNEPAYVEEVVKKIAEIRGENFETVREQIILNSLTFLGLSSIDR